MGLNCVTGLQLGRDAALRARNFELPDSLVAMTGSSRKNLRGFDIQSQNEEGRKDDDAYYATDGSL